MPFTRCLLLQGEVDKDGYLDYEEFVAIYIHLRKISYDEHFLRAFQFFDKNQSGYIELEELHNSLADEIDTNSEEVINAIMHDMDKDKISIFHFLSKYTPLERHMLRNQNIEILS
jgi:calcium-dependent protein kinase